MSEAMEAYCGGRFVILHKNGLEGLEVFWSFLSRIVMDCARLRVKKLLIP